MASYFLGPPQSQSPLTNPNGSLDKLREPNQHPLFGGNSMVGRNPREPFCGHLSSELNLMARWYYNKSYLLCSHRVLSILLPLIQDSAQWATFGIEMGLPILRKLNTMQTPHRFHLPPHLTHTCPNRGAPNSKCSDRYSIPF